MKHTTQRGAFTMILGVIVLVGAIAGIVYLANINTETQIEVKAPIADKIIAQRLATYLLPIDDSMVYGVIEFIIEVEKAHFSQSINADSNSIIIYLEGTSCADIVDALSDEPEEESNELLQPLYRDTAESQDILTDIFLNPDPTLIYSITLRNEELLPLACGDISLNDIQILEVFSDQTIKGSPKSYLLETNGNISGIAGVSSVASSTYIDVLLTSIDIPEDLVVNINHGTCDDIENVITPLGLIKNREIRAVVANFSDITDNSLVILDTSIIDEESTQYLCTTLNQSESEATEAHTNE